VLGELFTASLAAYGFARLRFPGRNTLFLVYLSTLIIPAQLLLVPRFILFQELGIHDTLPALILPDTLDLRLFAPENVRNGVDRPTAGPKPGLPP
jgi:ABC-type glycerol-3-phosphate transport system permease component